jgi:hypothetical protein
MALCIPRERLALPPIAPSKGIGYGEMTLTGGLVSLATEKDSRCVLRKWTRESFALFFIQLRMHEGLVEKKVLLNISLQCLGVYEAMNHV